MQGFYVAEQFVVQEKSIMYPSFFNEREFDARKSHWRIGRDFWCGIDTWEARIFLFMAKD